VRLFDRTTPRVSLTGVGREYYDRCAQILHELDEANEIATALQLSPRGKIRVHCHSGMAGFIAPAVAGYLLENPEVSVDLRTGDQMIDLLEEGFDLAIRSTIPPDSNLIVRRLFGWRHVLCCSPKYLKSHPAPRSPAGLASHNCLRYAFYPFGDEWHFIDPDGKPVAARVAGNLVTTGIELLRETALAGQRLLFTAPFIIHKELEAGSLVPLLLVQCFQNNILMGVMLHCRFCSAKCGPRARD
jgi:DNA-binding transcriptional LysR family regulator